MVFRRRGRGGKRRPGMRKRRGNVRKGVMRRVLGSSQVFTETYKAGVECFGVNALGEVNVASPDQGVGVKLLTQMNAFSQGADYAKLWNSYKILKVKYTIIPKWKGENYNEASIGTAGGISITETPRFCYSINDYDQTLSAPLTEIAVLQDNGCKIRQFTRPVVINVRPKPLLQQAYTNPIIGTPGFVNVYKSQWISFDGIGPTIPHVGVDGYFSSPNSLASGFMSMADIYVSVSFVCKDPR